MTDPRRSVYLDADLRPLEEAFTRSVVMSLAGPVVYGRGLGYFREGRVVPEASRGTRLRATVRGSVPYTVELSVEAGQPAWSCTCPAAEDGSFCKHCVAVALLLHPGADTPPGEEADTIAEAGGDLRGMLVDHLAGLDRDRLVELLLEAAAANWRLRERLLAEARASRGEGADLASWRRRVDAVFAPYGDFVSYQEAGGWAGEAEEVIDALEELCDAGHPDAVATLAEHAHRRAEEAIQYVDDSDGWLTGISERLAELHLRACTEGDPDPVELARRLVALELSSELDGFHRAAATYAGVLGPEGLAEYRRLLEPRWRRLQPDTGGWSSERFRVREAMIGVALAGGDPDELIEIRRHDLNTPDGYLEIARALAEVGRQDEAEAWAREGLERFVDRGWQTPPLREFLAELLRDRGDRSAAVELFWEAFERSPSLSTYRRLLEEAGDDTLKEPALGWLRARLADTSPDDGAGTTLVEVLAYEGDLEGAWQVAQQHGCDRRMWLTLARAREEAHPLEAVEVYQEEVFALIEAKKTRTYRQAVELLARIRRLADRAGRPDRFEEVLARVRAEHGRKRNLIGLLDQRGW